MLLTSVRLRLILKRTLAAPKRRDYPDSAITPSAGEVAMVIIANPRSTARQAA